jgi:iron-sulfur cluster assembly protein
METTASHSPVVTLTPAAVEQVRGFLRKPENEGKVLRLYVEKGGCSGMQYSMVFDERRDDDRVAEIAGVAVVVDAFSAEYLKGTVVDFSDDLTGGGFKITNPNARQSCGCGKSFSS